MWDNAPLLRNLANALFSLSVLAMLYGTVHYTVHLPEMLPLHGVRLEAAPQRIDVASLEQVLRSEVKGNFFTVNIEQLRQSLEKLVWVRSVSIRREFPDRLALSFEEHQPLAHWNNSALVNQQGEVFSANTDQALPEFIGQAGDSNDVAQHYAQFNRQLAALNLQVTRVALNARHAWQLRLSNGMVLELGHEDMQQRLVRFVAVYPYTEGSWQKAEGRSAAYVDLRYRNGFAVKG